MSVQTHPDVFTDVVNSMMQELHALPHSATHIRLIMHPSNLNSPVLAEMQHLSLFALNTRHMTALLPVFAQLISLTSLELSGCDLSPVHLEFLFTGCPAFSKLKSLDLRSTKGLVSEDLLLLSQSTALVNLTSLNLERCSAAATSRGGAPQNGNGFVAFGNFGEIPPGSSGLVALLSSPVVKNLTHLNLGDTNVNDPNIHITIATSPFLSNLVSLDLTRHKISPDAATALATSTNLANLTHFSLAYNHLELITQLFSPPSHFAQNLQSLDLSWNDVSTSSLQVVLNAVPRLRELILPGNIRLGSSGASLIATSMSNLTKLDLTDCGISDEGYAALATSPVLSTLRELNLDRNLARTESIIALINSSVVSNLTDLKIGLNHDPQLATAIAKSPSLSKLQRLDIGGTRAGDDGAIALARSTTLTNLTHLGLAYNGIGPEGVASLSTSPVVSKLTRLNLDFNEDIGNFIAILAAPSSTLYSLLELTLTEILMDDDGMLQLLSARNLDQLDVLDAYDNDFSGSTEKLAGARFRDDFTFAWDVIPLPDATQ